MVTRRFLLPAALLPAASLFLLPAAPRAQPGVDQPQPRLPTEPLVIETARGATHRFTVEMALAPDQQMIGLMFRPQVAPLSKKIHLPSFNDVGLHIVSVRSAARALSFIASNHSCPLLISFPATKVCICF